MTKRVVACFFLTVLICNSAPTQAQSSKASFPDQFIIGRHTFFDFGPPFDFYEVFSIHSTEKGTAIERITITPPGHACTQPATVQTATASVKESALDLLDKANPCTIPEKNLQRELKRCKHCMVFSGADVTMQLQCGDKTRRIRMDILDRDMFDPTSGTPQHTSWTMNLLGKLDEALGTSVMDKPIFSLPEINTPPASRSDSGSLDNLWIGGFDALFEKAPHKPSELFREALVAPVYPSVALVSSSPFSPVSPALPIYPPIAEAAHVEGRIAIKFDVTSTGETSNLSFVDGKALLNDNVAAAVSGWKFPKDAAGQQINAVIEFNMNCPSVKP